MPRALHDRKSAVLLKERLYLLPLEDRKMIRTLRAVIHDGKVELSEPVELPEGADVLVTVLPEGNDRFWQRASETSLAAIWDNAEDDVY